MHRLLCGSFLLGSLACAESHGRIDTGVVDGGLPDAIHVAVLRDARVLDIGSVWAGSRDGAVVTDAGTVQACAVLFPPTAFVQDLLERARDNTIARGALQIMRGFGAPSPNPTPSPTPRPENPIPGFVPPEEEDRTGNCGSEPVAGYAWDGHRCRGIRSTYCPRRNPPFECTRLAPTLLQCANDNATCSPEVCRRTHGQWSEVPISCNAGAWSNGVPFGNEDCQGLPSAQCICPVNHSFGETGCVPSATPLSAQQAGCYASGGRIDNTSCGPFTCGRPAHTACFPRPECNCGPNRNFNTTTLRCEIDARCDPAPDALCLASGGTWDHAICLRHYVCGIRPHLGSGEVCTDDRLHGGCNCGAVGVYDDELGCVLAPSCRTNACF